MTLSLSRRFSLLRTPAGDPVTIDDLRSKFAEQRAKGAENTISEEEEDMLLETIGKWRGRNSGSHHSQDQSGDSSFTATSDGGNTEESGSNSSTTVKLTGKGGGSSSASTSTTSSPSKSKRYSNNLFGSGRLRDYTYLRGVASSRNSGGASSKAGSITQSEDSNASPRPAATSSITDALVSSSHPTGSSMDEPTTSLNGANDQASVRSVSSLVHEGSSSAEYRLQKTLGPTGLMRASAALEDVIQEIEDEVEDEIVMPRSPPVPRDHSDQNPQHGSGFLQAGNVADGFNVSSRPFIRTYEILTPDFLSAGEQFVNAVLSD